LKDSLNSRLKIPSITPKHRSIFISQHDIILKKYFSPLLPKTSQKPRFQPKSISIINSFHSAYATYIHKFHTS